MISESAIRHRMWRLGREAAMVVRPSRRTATSGALWGLALASLATSSAVHGQCQYSVTVVQAPACRITGPPPGTPFGISAAGAIAGRYQQCLASDTEAFTWTAAGGFLTLPRPAASQGAQALAINDAGQIVGGDCFIAPAQGQREPPAGARPGAPRQSHARHGRPQGTWILASERAMSRVRPIKRPRASAWP